MTIPEDFKTRLKIAKSKVEKKYLATSKKKVHLWVVPSNWVQNLLLR